MCHASVLPTLMLKSIFPKATGANSPSSCSNSGSHKCLSSSCWGLCLLQLLPYPYYLSIKTSRIDIIWHRNKPSTKWQMSAEFWLSEGVGFPDFCHLHFIFSPLWARNHFRESSHSFVSAGKHRLVTSPRTHKPFFIHFCSSVEKSSGFLQQDSCLWHKSSITWLTNPSVALSPKR